MQTVIRKREGAREAKPRIVFIFISLVRGLFVEMSPAPHKLSVGFSTYWANEQTLVSGLQHSNSRLTPGLLSSLLRHAFGRRVGRQGDPRVA